jgi:hypothetical protein
LNVDDTSSQPHSTLLDQLGIPARSLLDVIRNFPESHSTGRSR